MSLLHIVIGYGWFSYFSPVYKLGPIGLIWYNFANYVFILDLIIVCSWVCRRTLVGFVSKNDVHRTQSQYWLHVISCDQILYVFG